MTEKQHPITPPPELVHRLRSEAPHGIRDAGATRERQLAIAAYRAGADAELRASCELLNINGCSSKWIDMLRTARRPKPPSLAEEALKALKRQAVRSIPSLIATEDCDTILAALERLQQLEQEGHG